MKKNNSNIWIGGKDLSNDPEFLEEVQSEFHQPKNLAENLGEDEVAESIGGNRRDFLKFLGFGLGAATIAAGCDIPVKRALPYVVMPENIVPGVATYYASTFVNGGDYCPVLVKTREGRPIKIEGNDRSTITKGGTTARAQASVLSLYDTARYPKPKKMVDGLWENSDWSAIDQEVKDALKSSNGTRIVTNTVLSPTLKQVFDEFASSVNNSKVVTYDPVSSAAILTACEEDFGVRAIPDYKFGEADVIVSFDADFLGTWISPVEYTDGFIKNRKVDKVENASMSRVIVVESGMSLTGSNADNRVLVKPSEMGAAIAYLANKIVGGVSAPTINEKAARALDKTAAYLKEARGKSLVVASSNNVAEQKLVNAINNALGNIGKTVGLDNVSYQRQGDEKALYELINDIERGQVDVVIFNECNPLYDFAGAKKLKAALEKVKLKVAMSSVPTETVEACNLLAPVHHFLESWGDAQPKKNEYSLIQPTIKNLFDTRQAGHSLLVWSESEKLNSFAKQPYLDYLKAAWQENIFSRQSDYILFDSFWDGALMDGVVTVKGGDAESAVTYSGSATSNGITQPKKNELEISFYENIAIGNGQYASNPWLQELPDPVKRTTWGNYLAIPVSFNGDSSMVGFQGLNDGDLVDVTIGDETITVPVVQQFGQMPGTVSLALGYGRSEIAKTGRGVGVNVNPFTVDIDGRTQYFNENVSISGAKGKEDYYSSVQYHHTYGVTGVDESTGNVINADEAALVFFDYFTGVDGYQGALTDRSVMYTSNIKDLKENVSHLQEKRAHAQHLNEQQIYNGYDHLYETGHHWGMHIDLTTCTGCGACAVACMAENNVPVVGKKEVSRHHEMTWLRIDRYFYGDVNNPNAVYQPMMCQHCDNAPCENVCPVNATNHSSEGLNQMTYNRCVGTRYCANNCPYKVRRFNWLDYTTGDLFPANQPALNGEREVPFGADDLTRMVLNPDVTVRVRGVIEKCSFCVQRIQEGKLTAKMEGRKLRDKDVRPACQTACPTGGITFGDLNNKGGELDKKLESPLNYIALEEVNVRSSVTYQMKVNNRDHSFDA